MVQNAIVKRIIRENVAEVSLLRQLECGLHCDGACAGCSQKPKEEIIALASNPIHAQPGEFVEVEPASGHNILIPMIVFLLPCIGLGAGYIAGQSLFQLGEGAALGTAVLGLILGFIPAYLLNRTIQNSKEPEFVILKHLNRGY